MQTRDSLRFPVIQPGLKMQNTSQFLNLTQGGGAEGENKHMFLLFASGRCPPSPPNGRGEQTWEDVSDTLLVGLHLNPAWFGMANFSTISSPRLISSQTESLRRGGVGLGHVQDVSWCIYASLTLNGGAGV